MNGDDAQCVDATERFDEFVERLDELNDGLLEAYAAGFSQAVETFDIDADFDTSVSGLKKNGAVAENHYYYWEGRSKPLELWLREQFRLDEPGGDYSDE